MRAIRTTSISPMEGHREHPDRITRRKKGDTNQRRTSSLKMQGDAKHRMARDAVIQGVSRILACCLQV